MEVKLVSKYSLEDQRIVYASCLHLSILQLCIWTDSSTLVSNTKSLFYDCWRHCDGATDLSRSKAHKFQCICFTYHINQHLWSSWSSIHSCWYHLSRKRLVTSDLNKNINLPLELA